MLILHASGAILPAKHPTYSDNKADELQTGK
jgi:hypothetical protein